MPKPPSHAAMPVERMVIEYSSGLGSLIFNIERIAELIFREKMSIPVTAANDSWKPVEYSWVGFMMRIIRNASARLLKGDGFLFEIIARQKKNAIMHARIVGGRGGTVKRNINVMIMQIIAFVGRDDMNGFSRNQTAESRIAMCSPERLMK